MKIMNRGAIWLKVAVNYFKGYSPVNAEILNPEDTIAYMKKTGKSFLRLGDGEFNLLLGRDVHYQKFSPELKQEIHLILQDYNENLPYIVAVPHQYFSNSNRVLNRRVLISCWSIPKQIFRKYAKPDIVYGDAFLFAKNHRKLDYAKLWRNIPNVIVVHNKPEYLQGAYDPETQKGFFVQIPPCNTYEAIDETEEQIKAVYAGNNLDVHKTVILLSAGPAAKVLVKRMSSQGYYLIDCGHAWDDPLEV